MLFLRINVSRETFSLEWYSMYMAGHDKTLGNLGENIACGYLSDKGYKILRRNFVTLFGEIDIITKSPDNTLVFVEVKSTGYSEESGKSIRQSYPQSPLTKTFNIRAIRPIYPYKAEMRLDPAKIKKLQKLSKWYINKFYPTQESFRIDGVCVDIFSSGEYNVRHYWNVG
jgi:Holliday junction resolvase-like predicted endonuclease